MNPEIVRYLAENRGRYTDAALRDALVRAGHPGAEVDEALASLVPGGVERPPGSVWSENDPEARRDRRGVTRSPKFWLVLVGFVIGLYAAVLLSSFAVNAGGLPDLIPLVVAAVILLAGATGWARLQHDDRPLAMGLGCGVVAAILIPFIAIVVLFGICVAGVAQVP
ncbi:MAG: hypothetical protein H0X16_07525 [Chloroflexi bacterium]|nr:hypothetical protein [Chloroflexota bacterium]